MKTFEYSLIHKWKANLSLKQEEDKEGGKGGESAVGKGYKKIH